MAKQQSLLVTAALCRLYINNVVYAPSQSVSVSIETGEYEVRGINSPFAQEIAGGGQYSVRGSAGVVRTKNSGGLQAANARPLFSDIAASSYVSLRLEDRSTGETLWSIPKAKLSNVKETVQAKGIYNISFDFVGQILYWPLDLS
jgi:hypothetical protein